MKPNIVLLIGLLLFSPSLFFGVDFRDEKMKVPPVYTAGKITITYTRSSEGKNTYKGKTYYTPYRVAVWIEDSDGKLLKTLYRSVGGKIEPFPARLEHWEKKSGKTIYLWLIT